VFFHYLINNLLIFRSWTLNQKKRGPFLSKSWPHNKAFNGFLHPSILNLTTLLTLYKFISTIRNTKCLNPSLGLTTKAGACKVAGQEGSLGVTHHAPESVGKCEGMNPHTPKGASTLGVGFPMDFQIFKKQLQGSKANGLNSSLYH